MTEHRSISANRLMDLIGTLNIVGQLAAIEAARLYPKNFDLLADLHAIASHASAARTEALISASHWALEGQITCHGSTNRTMATTAVNDDEPAGAEALAHTTVHSDPHTERTTTTTIPTE